MGRTKCTGEPRTSLRRLMIEQGLTTSKLAVVTGIPVSTIAGCAGGTQKMRPDRVAVLADALNVAPEELSDITGIKGSAHPFRQHFKHEPEVKLPEPAVKPKPYAEKDEDVEKLWLYFHNMNRRVMALEAEVKALKEGK